MKILLAICVLISAVVTSEKLYDHFKAYDFTVDSLNTAHKLAKWQDIEGVDFWRFGAPGVESRVMIPPDHVDEFEKFLVNENIQFEIRSENVGEIVEKFNRDQVRRMDNATSRRFASSPVSHPGWDVYWTFDEINNFGYYLAENYPQFVTRENIAQTYEGRDIFALKISRGGFGRKPIIFMDAGIHAREWVSPATVCYFIHRLVEDPETNVELLSNVDWIIFPTLNPDGYEYTHTKNRMWRKNRRQLNKSCIGVDLNRNFEFSWKTSTRFSALGGCRSDVYGGPSPNSEIETQALIQTMARYRENVRLYLAVHSYGNIVAWPWGYSGSPGHTDNWKYHDKVGNLFADAIRAETGKKYRVGNTADLLGNAYGAADDHMHGDQRINLVYTLELTGGGQTGFDYPEKGIEALRYETFLGYRAFGLHIANEQSRNYY